MINIWGFLLQTLSVSGVALVLLAVRRLLRDKVSPDIQYVFWMALLARILLPVRAGVSILFPFPAAVEVLKAKTERGLSSAYSGMYELAGSRHILPVYHAAPQSVTDWLFIIYGAGAVLVLLGYALAYIRLRMMIGRAHADAGQQKRADAVALAYGLRRVPVRTTPHIFSPFVCGVLRPVLVLPEDREMDELVILHELLHREHSDPAKNLCWCVLRALHWCNPFLWYVINLIENDLETCNDQRVLECLEGEVRRAYGNTLLAMAADRYARMPGTSSISNGSKNIARRIEAIVRFRKYPKGVTFVLVCIAVILAGVSVQGQTFENSSGWQHPDEADELDYALAESRVHRCTTLAGALDTYAKGVLYKNGIYLAMASPLSAQAALEAQMRENAGKRNAFYVDSGIDGQGGMYLYETDGYCICNLRADEKSFFLWRTLPVSYEAILVFGLRFDPERPADAAWEAERPQAEDGVLQSSKLYNEPETLALPVRVRRTAGEGWVVERAGHAWMLDAPFDRGFLYLSPFPGFEPLRQYETDSDYGRVTLDVYSICEVEGNHAWGWYDFVLPEDAGGNAANPDAAFGYAYAEFLLEYDARGARAGAPERRLGILCTKIPDGEAGAPYPEDIRVRLNRCVENAGGGSDDYTWENRWEKDGFRQTESDLVVKTGIEHGIADADIYGEIYANCGVQIYWDGELVDEFQPEEKYGKQETDGRE